MRISYCITTYVERILNNHLQRLYVKWLIIDDEDPLAALFAPYILWESVVPDGRHLREHQV
jgi:hypothetical protein